MSYATFTCPSCGDVQSPMLHTVHSSCGGKIYWKGSYLVCEDDDTTIYSFKCDECGATPSKNECAS